MPNPSILRVQLAEYVAGVRQWRDITNDTIALKFRSGGPRRSNCAAPGDGELLLNNRAGTYTPPLSGNLETTLLRVGRRVRLVRYGDDLADTIHYLEATGGGHYSDLYREQTVTTTITAGDLWCLSYYARAMWDHQHNTDMLSMRTSAETGIYETEFTYDTQWTLYRYYFRAASNGTTITPRVRRKDCSTGGTAHSWKRMDVEYKTFDLRKTGGANVLGAWSGSAYVNLLTDKDHEIVFNGMIGDVAPDAFNYSDQFVSVPLRDMLAVMQDAPITIGLQKDKRIDEIAPLIVEAWHQNAVADVPGLLVERGKETIGLALDAYEPNAHSCINALEELALTEIGDLHVKNDGTLFLGNRSWPFARGLALTKPAEAVLRLTVQPSNNQTFEYHGITFTWKTTLTGAANEIKIGVTLDDSADNAAACLSNGPGYGTLYGAQSGSSSPATVTASVAYEWPRRASIIVGRVITGNAGLPVLDSACAIGMYGYQNPAANGDVQEWTALLDAGRYTIKLLCLTLTDAGKADLSISYDGRLTWVSISTGNDFYSAATTRNVVKTWTGVDLATAGYIALRLTTNGQNASSSGYKIPVVQFSIFNELGD